MTQKSSLVLILLVISTTIACSNDPATTRQQAAKTTEELKRESCEAAGNVKKGAEVARTELRTDVEVSGMEVVRDAGSPQQRRGDNPDACEQEQTGDDREPPHGAPTTRLP